MPDPHLLMPGLLCGPGKYTHAAHVWSSPPGTVHQSSLYKPQPIVKRHSAPVIPLNDCPLTTSPWKPPTVASMSMEALLVSKFETKLDILSAPSPGDPTKDQLRKQIIAALTIADKDNTETIRFPHVSEDDYDHVMSTIAEIDELVRKPAYIPDLECFIAYKMPSRTHTSFLPPMSRAIGRALESIPINALWDLILPIHMSSLLTIMAKKLGMPDLLLEMDGPGGNAALWIMEVSFSRMEDEVMSSIRRYAMECKDAQVITIIDVCESHSHKKPKDISELAIAMEGRDLLTLKEWKIASDNPAFGPVMSSVPHQWVSPLTIKVKTWLRPPDGEFSLDETNSSSYYACAEICPARDSAEIAHLDSVFRQAMKLIRDKIVGYVQEHCELDEENLSAMREWIPPDALFDWDKVMNHVRKGVLQDGFDRYCDWHVNLKRRADELAEQLPQEGSSKRPKRG